jgi:hypothetical protein
MNIKRLCISSLIVGGIAMAGCAGPSLLEQNWGRSVETARFNQTLNPQAGENLEPVTGMDGESAGNALEAYRQSFKADEKSAGYDVKLTGIGMKK